MATTLTSTLVAARAAGTAFPKIDPSRVNVVRASFNVNGGTVTPGLVIQMLPIPTGCRVLRVDTVSEWAGNAAGVFSVGDGGSTTRYVVSASLTATSRVTSMNGAGLNYKYSLSDDVAVINRFDTIDVVIGAGATQTGTGSILMTAWYTYEGET